jgi:DNA-binding SARP family transcriptional activator
MIELRVLGSTVLSGVVEDRMRNALRRPKSLALLTYLLVARPRGFQRRERLLTLFWPDRNHTLARHALRQSLHELRHNLGDVIESRGADEVGVSSSVWCDAVAFDDALTAQDLARAISLWRGELLDGIVIHAASHELREWLVTERARYREDTARAACGLAERAAADRDWPSLSRWARIAETLAPLDEVVLWRLLELYRDIGYRAGAEKLYRLFVHRMKAELALAPSARTQALICEIRTDPHEDATVA